jgi:glycosyltransferase involved in cell wall biosynthesis
MLVSPVLIEGEDGTTRPATPSLSLVFPTYNEEGNITASVERASAVLSKHFADYEIIIVNDGSTDGTAAIADDLARRDGRVRVIHHGRNCKLGRTLRTGFNAATKELVFYTDSDLPIDFNDVPRGLELLRRADADMVIGYRLDRNEPWYRVMYSRVYNWLVGALFDLNVRDTNFSYKLFKKEGFESRLLNSEGSFIDAEILARARMAGARIVEMGVHYFPRRAGRSTLARPAVIFKIIAEMSVFWWREWRKWRGCKSEVVPDKAPAA